MLTRRKATALIAALATTALARRSGQAAGYTGKFINVMTGSEINNVDILQLQNYSGWKPVRGCSARTPQGTIQLGILAEDYPTWLEGQAHRYEYLTQTTVNQNQQIDNSIDNSINDSFNDHSSHVTTINDHSGSQASVNNC